MGRRLTVQDSDDDKIEELRQFFEVPTKIAIVRMALALLDKERVRQMKVNRWCKAAQSVKQESANVNSEFRKRSSTAKRTD